MAGGWREFGACLVPSGWAGLAEGWRGLVFLPGSLLGGLAA